jgi:hypothetical protein
MSGKIKFREFPPAKSRIQSPDYASTGVRKQLQASGFLRKNRQRSAK